MYNVTNKIYFGRPRGP